MHDTWVDNALLQPPQPQPGQLVRAQVVGEQQQGDKGQFLLSLRPSAVAGGGEAAAVGAGEEVAPPETLAASDLKPRQQVGLPFYSSSVELYCMLHSITLPPWVLPRKLSKVKSSRLLGALRLCATCGVHWLKPTRLPALLQSRSVFRLCQPCHALRCTYPAP